MNKKWFIYLFAFLLIIEYKTGYKKLIIVDEYKIGKTITILRIGKHRKYIDMRRVKGIRKFRLEEIW